MIGKDETKPKMYYVTLMYRYGNLEKHSYAIYIGENREEALAIGLEEEDYRGGKYSAWVGKKQEDCELIEKLYWESGSGFAG